MKRKAAFLLMFTVLMLVTSCRNDSPAREYADVFNDIAAEIDRENSNEATLKMFQSGKPEWTERVQQIIEGNEDYELTADDKTLIKESMKHFLEVSVKKSLEFQGEKPEGTEASVNAMLEMSVYPKIDAARTLGDLK
ncbi:MAG: hypothetical protein NC338_03065 [Firmicutes bacterium]|nr:hypothetical protein [Bacillota bacterium]MCM1401257.1 hypothetical protein [Bacteroides sp.]MCM1477194.1 hypothetical protein [Bacteroides sp.]